MHGLLHTVLLQLVRPWLPGWVYWRTCEDPVSDGFFFFFFCGKKLAVHTNVISPERSDQNGIGWEAFLVLDMCFCRPRCVQQKEKKGREGKNKNSICWCWVLQTKHLYMYSVLVCNILWYTKLEIFGCIENKVCHFLSMP